MPFCMSPTVKRKKMKNLYVSRFCYLFRSTAGSLLAYSSKTNSFIELSEQLFEILRQHQLNEAPITTNVIPSNTLDTLYGEGFVGFKEDDENFVLESQFITQAVQHDATKLDRKSVV